ncbi:MAG: PIN domain-containing protein [Candidatus Entotheonellia bacterium]
MVEQLFFVDTNIWLDFYRSRTEAELTLLKHLDAIRDRIIISSQVEMEFMKHRQAVILESIRELKPPSHISRPGLFSDAKAVRALNKNLKQAEERVKLLKDRLSKVFERPAIYDPVYKVCQRVFHKNDELNLSRSHRLHEGIGKVPFKPDLFGHLPPPSFGCGPKYRHMRASVNSRSSGVK